jgi:diaminopimelate decarboxylase/aspartate kinase
MPTVIAIFSPQLSPEEVAHGARLLQETHPGEQIWCWLAEGQSAPSLGEGEGPTSSYRELPGPSEWSGHDLSKVVYLARDPRFFTAPRFIVPSSHALDTVSYDVAQELVGFFSEHLTPGFVAALAEADLPLWLTGPEGSTRVEHPRGAAVPAVRSIVVKQGVVLLSISTTRMWKQAGFLGRIFTLCADHGISVDQVSASESEVTLTLDGDREQLSAELLEKLVAALSQLGAVVIEQPCAAVTLVGRRIRSTLSQLAPVLARFEEERVFLISQAAGDNNLTFVVEQSKADKLVRDLHRLLFPVRHDGSSRPSDPGLAQEQAEWWVQEREPLLRMARHQNTPFFLLHQPTVERQLQILSSTSGCDRFLFAMKSNHHPDLLRTVRAHGVKFECVSPQEIDHLFSLFPDLTGEEILYTPNFASAEDFRRGFDRGTYVTLDNHSPLEDHPELFRGRKLALRVDPGQGEGHHKHVKTAGRGSKFGIDLEMLPRTRERLAQLDCQVIGLHCHAGSGIHSVSPWLRNAEVLARLLPMFPEAKFLDLGGGFGVPERPGESPLDLGQLQTGLAQVRKAYPHLEIWLEPGRFIVAQAGILLTRVTQVKTKGDHTFVGVDAGMNSLIRPALYGAYHPVINLSRYHDPRTVQADVVGPICESGDVLGSQRLLPESRPGDLFLIGNTGAYGRVMSSSYNMRPPAPELWWTGPKAFR